ncbi:collagen alpha-3(VI) chain-like [Pangshura tecta]
MASLGRRGKPACLGILGQEDPLGGRGGKAPRVSVVTQGLQDPPAMLEILGEAAQSVEPSEGREKEAPRGTQDQRAALDHLGHRGQLQIRAGGASQVLQVLLGRRATKVHRGCEVSEGQRASQVTRGAVELRGFPEMWAPQETPAPLVPRVRRDRPEEEAKKGTQGLWGPRGHWGTMDVINEDLQGGRAQRAPAEAMETLVLRVKEATKVPGGTKVGKACVDPGSLKLPLIFQGPLGRKGDQGLRGSVGPPGEMGLRGLPGAPLFTPCELIASIRERCDPDSLACPLFPTELALVVEASANVTPAEFGRMKDALAFLLRDLRISQGNCPAGARVALLSYASTTTYLLRFTDMQTKGLLLRQVGDLSYVHSTQRGRLAAAMRFVGRNTFKRVRPALLGRKVAVFLTSGRGQAQEDIGKVALEYVALGIIPVVVTFSSLPVVEQAFQMDETFRVVQLPAADSSRDVEALREAVFLCTLCFDICKLGNCTKEPLLQNPQGLDLDLVLLVDNSPVALPVGSLGRVTHLFSSILDHLKISPSPELPDSGARVSLVLTGPSRAHLASGEVLWEFPFTQHGSRERIKEHLQLSLAAREAAMPASQAMEWTLRHAFRESPSHKLRMLFAVVTRETDLWDQETLPELSRFAQCGAFAMFILALGLEGAGKQEGIVPEPLAFPAWRYHFLRLGSVQEPEMEYAERMVLGFLRNLLVESRQRPLEHTSAWCELELSPTNPSATLTPPVSPDRVSKLGALPQDGMEAATISPSEVRGVVDSEDPCFLGNDSGVACTNYSLWWYYRVDTGSCNRFWYGGCGGNANRFNSEQDCIRVCIDRSTHAAGLGEEKNLTQAVCLEDRDSGPCHSFTLKWFFNKTQPARCTPFWYGGCEGNRNRFETRELCESTCLPLAGQMLLQQSAGESLQADESRPGCASGADM